VARDLFLGSCIHFGDVGTRPLDYTRMREAGLDWTRIDLPFPFDGTEKKEHARYVAAKEQIRALRAHGIRTLGITPYMRDWPMHTGELGSMSFLSTYRAACAYMARDLADVIDTWQVCNELNLAWFRRPFATEVIMRGHASEAHSPLPKEQAPLDMGPLRPYLAPSCLWPANISSTTAPQAASTASPAASVAPSSAAMRPNTAATGSATPSAPPLRPSPSTSSPTR